ncbi:alpha/beta-tubulin-N-acetyltransferase 9 [Chanos chanos]|uniref:Alpha/beta-tubulin-N-acetyltransferase 9 n=1 Tax=Chanos chanos TaxID=29144 RepID=A0A6J2VGV7_CHACN|nr:N-acetyltransferase 9 [Chanos chanos]
MRINQDTLLEGEKVVLVPYNADHVPRYHQWMASPELQKLTASEPLSLEQEYDMQKSWREDDDKCTFIVLDKQRWEDPSVSEEDCMVGDVNIFLTDPADPTLAELEVMIAEPSSRGKGLGKEVTHMMMCYGIQNLGIRNYEVKIGLDNEVSIAMFKKFGFHELSVSEVFQETTLGLIVDEKVQREFLENLPFMQEREYGKAKDSRQAAEL